MNNPPPPDGVRPDPPVGPPNITIDEFAEIRTAVHDFKDALWDAMPNWFYKLMRWVNKL